MYFAKFLIIFLLSTILLAIETESQIHIRKPNAINIRFLKYTIDENKQMVIDSNTMYENVDLDSLPLLTTSNEEVPDFRLFPNNELYQLKFRAAVNNPQGITSEIYKHGIFDLLSYSQYFFTKRNIIPSYTYQIRCMPHTYTSTGSQVNICENTGNIFDCKITDEPQVLQAFFVPSIVENLCVANYDPINNECPGTNCTIEGKDYEDIFHGGRLGTLEQGENVSNEILKKLLTRVGPVLVKRNITDTGDESLYNTIIGWQTFIDGRQEWLRSVWKLSDGYLNPFVQSQLLQLDEAIALDVIGFVYPQDLSEWISSSQTYRASWFVAILTLMIPILFM
ncbi:MAG: hypothetical protein EZS28_004773 [Streblomastix strix]|uniref:Uncharacterized protein n=1 Tax=Streblomastix strix TaxID=222440 RepID=A0A5J4WXX5_9EUKA|nr:MAG: hypothetical protein EZS28_004772 [Streblomastix strix]KAA6399702.1 MAG: hypothetical protein EZS28_004773 [Streblomastix strix]